MIDLTADKRKEVCEINVDRGDRDSDLDAPTVLAVINTPLSPEDFKTRNVVIIRDTGYNAYALYRIDPNLHYGARNFDEFGIAAAHLENKADFIKIGDRAALVLGSLDTAADITKNDDLWFSQPAVFGPPAPSVYDNFTDAPSVFSPHYAYAFDSKSWLIEQQEELQEKITYMQLEGADGFFPMPGYKERDASVLVDLKTRFYDKIPNNTLDIRTHPTFDSVYSFFTAYATGSGPGLGIINTVELHQDPTPIIGSPWTTTDVLTEDKKFLRAVDVVDVAMRRAKTFGASKDLADRSLAHPFHPPFIIEDYLSQTRFSNAPGFDVDSTSVVSDANMQIYYEEASKLLLGNSFEELGKQVSCAMGPFSAASIMRMGPYTVGAIPNTTHPNWAQGLYNHETISDELEELIQSTLGISIRNSKDLAVIQDVFLDDTFGKADNRTIRYSVQGFSIKKAEVKWYDLRFSNFSHTLTPAQDRQGMGAMKMLNLRQLRDLITLEGPTSGIGNDFDDDTRGVLTELGFDPNTYRSLFDEIYHAVGAYVDPHVLPGEFVPNNQQDWGYIERNPFTIPRINLVDGGPINPAGVVEGHYEVRTRFKLLVHQILDLGFFVPKVITQQPLLYDFIETLNIAPNAVDSIATIQSNSTSFSATRASGPGNDLSERTELFSDIYEALDNNELGFSGTPDERERAIAKRLEMYKQFREMLSDKRWSSVLKLKELTAEARVHVVGNLAQTWALLPPPLNIISFAFNLPQVTASFDVADAQIDAFMNVFNFWRARALQIIDALIQHDWREPNYFRGRDITVARGGVIKAQEQNIVFASKISESVEMNAYMTPRVMVQSVYNFYDAGENELNPHGPIVNESGDPQMKNIVQWVPPESVHLPIQYSNYSHKWSGYDRLTKEWEWRHVIKGYELQKFDSEMNLVETVELPPTEPLLWTDVNIVYGQFYYYRVRALWNLTPHHAVDAAPPAEPPSDWPEGALEEIPVEGPAPSDFSDLGVGVFEAPPEPDPNVTGAPFAGGPWGGLAVNISELEEFLNGIASPGPIVIGPASYPRYPAQSPLQPNMVVRFPTANSTAAQTNTGDPAVNINPGYTVNLGETVIRQPEGYTPIQERSQYEMIADIDALGQTLGNRVDAAGPEFANEFLMNALLNIGEFNG